jgi:hypothetical protein
LGIQKHIKNIYQDYKEWVYNNRLGIPFDDFVFSPEDIALKDDAFHGSDNLHFIEWWYFDATLCKEYSIQLCIQVFQIINQGFAYLTINIYQNGLLKGNRYKIYPLSEFYGSPNEPLVSLGGKTIMHGYIHPSSEKWVYDLSFQIEDVSAELRFINSTKGWKGSIIGGKWAVILPRAEVNGTLQLDNEKISVTGVGYHDHNWDLSVTAGLNFGWIWGKTHSRNYSITWSAILKTWFWDQPLVVLNEKNNGYLNIPSEGIFLEIQDIRIDNGVIVPHSFALKVNNNNVSIHLRMEAQALHHTRVMGIINYCRYHVHCTGPLTIENKEEIIDEVQITEFIRFRYNFCPAIEQTESI